ncbi:MAG: nucleotide exchange factor GrpE [Phycisphaerales bacterium]|nr:nucleotide exchange factor GrpE [Phycisphaerales bacterium]
MNSKQHNGPEQSEHEPRPERREEPSFDPERLDDPDEVAQLLEAYQTLQERLEEAEERHEQLLRHVSDAKNETRRAKENAIDQRRQGVTSVARDVITALDHFDMALAQDLSKANPDSLVQGMRAIREELVRAVTQHGVLEICPKAGDEFDPMRHEAIAQHAVEGVEPGRIVSAVQVGFALGERVIRPAKVVVSPASDDEGNA